MPLNFRLSGRSAIFYQTLAMAWLGVATSVLVGCDSAEPIRQYTIPTIAPAQLRPSQQRMIAAMVPIENEVWFFKITAGPKSAVDQIESTFRDFVKTRTYEDGSPDLEQLPGGWRRGADKPFRFASIDINTSNKQLDLSVSKLSAGEDWDEYVAMNVNRWRTQVGLPESEAKWAGGEEMDVDATDRSGIWVDLVGDGSAEPSPMIPPFAGAAGVPSAAVTGDDPHANLPQEMQRQIAAGEKPAATSANGPPNPIPTPEAEESPLKYDRPEGWRDGRMSMMRMAAFEVGDQDPPTEITVITAGGDIRSNVKRWLGQAIGETPSDEQVDEVMQAAETVDVDGRDGQRFLLQDSSKDAEKESTAIDAVIVPLEGGMSLFVKMTGDKPTVADQRDNMSSFVESLSFE